MELQPGAACKRGDRRTAIAAQFRRPGNGAPQRRGDAGGIKARQHGVNRRARAVTRDDHRDLLGRQAALAGLAAALTRFSRQVGPFALE